MIESFSSAPNPYISVNLLKFLRNFLLFLILAVFGSISLYWVLARYTDLIPKDIVRHLDNVWDGLDRLDGGHTPNELIRHAEKRLYGHTRLEAVSLPVLKLIQSRYERPVPPNLPDLGKGQRPVEEVGIQLIPNYLVSDIDELAKAVAKARPGQTIELAPGIYEIRKRLLTGAAGTENSPITVRAAKPGSVLLNVKASEGIKVSQPYWVFENLKIQGICSDDKYCDHAFHVVGNAAHTTIRNNWIADFNAHIKVNGEGGAWPDEGLLQFNTLTSTHSRNTDVSVTSFDLVGADRWVVADNLVTDFVKSDGNRVSYGIFMKGSSSNGRIERNLVICTSQEISRPGVRVGISFGGGGTDVGLCRIKGCPLENLGGIAVNNIVAHCNDFGIDAIKAKGVLIANNTLINTSGIDIRGDMSSAKVFGNLLEGRIRSRAGSRIDYELNEIADLSSIFINPDALQLGWKGIREAMPVIAGVGSDFCNLPRHGATFSGASNSSGGC